MLHSTLVLLQGVLPRVQVVLLEKLIEGGSPRPPLLDLTAVVGLMYPLAQGDERSRAADDALAAAGPPNGTR